MTQRLVAGVDSSTQSCKVLVIDAETSEIVRTGRSSHPDGTEVDPNLWWEALLEAIQKAGGLGDLSAISIAGQQHGMVLLDSAGQIVRPALLWNDTRSSKEAQELIDHFGSRWLAENTGSVPVPSFTSTKLRWVRNNEPQLVDSIAAVCLPHDYLSWRLSSHYPDVSQIFTDRSDASGTGYFNPRTNEYLSEVIEFCLGKEVLVPRIVHHLDAAAQVSGDLSDRRIDIGAGMGDNAGAAQGLGLTPGKFAVSLGTSGTVFGSFRAGASDETGIISGFADAEGNFLPLVCTLNAARVIEWGAALLGVSLDEFGELAIMAKPGAEGVVVTPYLEGERTPNLPDATASVTGITLLNGNRENFARACIEGMLRGLAFGASVITDQGEQIFSIALTGGAAANPAVRRIAGEIFSAPVSVPDPAEYVALGAAMQAMNLQNFSA